MFSRPSREDGWYVISGEPKDGSQVDLFRNGEAIRWEKPELVSATYKNQRWRKYMRRLEQYGTTYRPYYERYLCHSWNITHEAQKSLNRLKFTIRAKRICQITMYRNRKKTYSFAIPVNNLLLNDCCRDTFYVFQLKINASL